MTAYNRDTDSYITDRALELFGTMSESEIAKIISDETGLDISRNVVHGRIYRSKNVAKLRDKPRLIMPYFSKYTDYYSGSWPAEKKVDYDYSSGPLKILVLNDLHVPFQNEAALEQALSNNRSADVVITSEVADMYSLTSFAKYQHVPFEYEVEEIIRWFEYLNASFPATYVLHSGHDRRLSRYVLSRIRSDLLFLIETDLLDLLARPFPNVVVIPDIKYSINDAIFTHFDISSSIPMRSAVRTHEWIQSWKEHLDIPPYKLLVQAHSHKSGVINLPGVQLVESGCFQTIPEWIFRKFPKQSWVHGYCVVFQNDGVTNLDATRVCVYRGN